MNSYWKNILIGVFVLTSLLVSISFIIFLEPKVGDGEKTLQVRFSNISGISEGTRVTFAGKPVGEVQTIREVPNARQDVTDQLKRVYFYELTLKLDSRVQVYTTDEISVQTTGLLGEKTVGIIPKAPTKGVPLKPITDQIVYAISIDPLENTLSNVSKVSQQIQLFVRNVDEWFMENEEELGQVVTSFSQAMNELESTLSSINSQKLVEKITQLVGVFKKDLDLFGETLQEARDKNLIEKINVVLENIAEATESFNIDGKQILRGLNIAVQDIASGKGSLGRFIRSDEFYLRVTSLLSKANTLLNDVNHYGVLFQYDKGWQKKRTRRANLLDSISTPKEFRQYFSDEVDQINTSLSRISILLEKADTSEEKRRILESHCFKEDFMHLLLDVEALFDNLKIYNEKLIDYYDEQCAYEK